MRTRKARLGFVVVVALLLQAVIIAPAFAADPVITSFSPPSGPPGTTVTITGTGFTGVNDVEFNNVNALSFTVNNDTSITAAAPCNVSDGPIEVTVPGGGGGTDSTDDASGPMLADFDAVANTPTVTNFNPSQGWVGRAVTINGTNFRCVTLVEFDGVNQNTFTVVSPTQITTTVPAGATDGVISVTAGGVVANSVGSFDVTTAPAPTVSSFNPTSGPPGTSVVIMGSAFTGATAVRFGGVNSSFTVNNDGQITATVPTTADTGAISVVTPGGTGVSSTSFNVIVGGPVISNFTPTSGVTGTSVQINGSNFNGTTSVKFNNVAATFAIVNDTRINATVPATATTGKISVTNAAGTTLSSTDFTVTGQGPSITSFSPTSGPVGTVVTITGSGFNNTLTVEFNGKNAQFSVTNPTTISATVPNGATTGKIKVTTTVAVADSAADFVVTIAPTISSFTPTSAPVGDTVTINGTHFNGTTSVKFNGTTATFTIDNDGKITTSVPAGATTGKITVTNSAGTATSATDFTVLPPRAVVSSFSPGNGKVGTEITITGSNFTGTTAVTFNGTAAQFVVNSSTEIKAVVPLGATTGKIAVTTPSGTGTSSTDFVVTKVHPRTVSLSLNKHLHAAGAITVADGFSLCAVNLPVEIQKKRKGKGWRVIGTATTNAAGQYSIDLPDGKGRYRARAVKAFSTTDICPKATSAAQLHKHKR